MVTTDAAHDFWTKSERSTLQKLAKKYERNIEIKHPKGGPCSCPENNCIWAKTKITYPEYQGPSL